MPHEFDTETTVMSSSYEADDGEKLRHPCDQDVVKVLAEGGTKMHKYDQNVIKLPAES